MPSEIKLYDEEQDLEEEDEKENDYQNLLKETKASIRELKEVKKRVAPLLFDLKDGTLKRVAPSRYN
jgi:hypothetical protein